MKIFTVILLLLSFDSFSKTHWSDFSATLLQGSNYEVGDDTRTVFTFEHAAGYSWGDSFLFVDRLHSDNGDKETYAEISPRFTISSYQNDFIKNIYIATTAEVGDGFTNYLVGFGTDLKIPHFQFFKVNLYRRNNEFGDNSTQATIAWAVPIGPLVYDGFLDHVPSKNGKSTSTNFTSQLKYNIGSALNLETNLFVGVEYTYWKNKFGIDGIDENNVNLLVKYHF